MSRCPPRQRLPAIQLSNPDIDCPLPVPQSAKWTRTTTKHQLAAFSLWLRLQQRPHSRRQRNVVRSVVLCSARGQRNDTAIKIDLVLGLVGDGIEEQKVHYV
jgi:hypothetical protein